jgi:glycosyltransferase involved in cell wall biosynthesis
MAVRNGGGSLEQAIESIARQTFPHWEMLIVDDASTDQSAALALAWAAHDTRIRVIANPSKKGQTACLNQGLASCRGEWIARQDADDISHPERLAKQAAYLEKNPGTVLLGTQGTIIDNAGKRIGLLDTPADSAAISWCAPFLNPFIHTSVVFRRETVKRLGGYDETYEIAQDYDLWTRLAAEHPSANLDGRLVSYRYAQKSLSNAGRDLALAEADRVSEREVLRWLGRKWSADEKTLVSDFRRGLRPPEYADFWAMIGAIERETSSRLPVKLRAAWHLKLAGATGAITLSEISSAFRAAPGFSADWIVTRVIDALLPRRRHL